MEIEEQSFRTSFFYWLGVIERLANARFVEALGGSKSIVARWRTLSVLAETNGSTITELAQNTFIERSALSHLLDLMEEEGLLQRQTRQGDRRTTEIMLTEEGREMFATMLPVRRAIFREASDGLSQTQLMSFMETLHTLVANLSSSEERVETGSDPAPGSKRPARRSPKP